MLPSTSLLWSWLLREGGVGIEKGGSSDTTTITAGEGGATNRGGDGTGTSTGCSTSAAPLRSSSSFTHTTFPVPLVNHNHPMMTMMSMSMATTKITTMTMTSMMSSHPLFLLLLRIHETFLRPVEWLGNRLVMVSLFKSCPSSLFDSRPSTLLNYIFPSFNWRYKRADNV